jgi:cytochrome c
MNLDTSIIIKGLFASVLTLLIVFGIIRTGNKLFYVESINPPSSEELLANIDYIDESHFLTTPKPNSEKNYNHTILGREDLKEKIKKQKRFVKHFKSVVSVQELDKEINITQNNLDALIAGKYHTILNKTEIETKIPIIEGKLNLLKNIRSTYGETSSSEIAGINTNSSTQVVVAEKPKLSFEELLTIASIESGKKVSSKCIACHGFNSGGGNRIGPNLWNILGTNKANAAGFSYSDSLKSIGGEWSIEEMNLWLKSPKKYAPGNAMSFVGLRKDKDRANLIAYLNSMSDKPIPLQ